MTPLLYVVVGSMALFLSTRTFLDAREDPARRAFLGFGWALAVCYFAFALSLLPGLRFFRVLYMGAACFVPATALLTFDQVFDPQESRTPTRSILAATTVVGPLLTVAHTLLSVDGATTAPQILAGALGFVVLGVALGRLWEAHQHTSLDVERVRLKYLIGVTVGAVGFTLLEQLTRVLTSPGTVDGLGLGARVAALQGPLPPFSVIFAGVALYLLHHTLVLSRLLDLHELSSRIFALLLSAGMLVLIDGLTFLWVDTFSTYPLHTTFQIFLASLMFLAAYEPMRPYIAWASGRLLNQRGQRLQATLANLVVTLPSVIRKEALAEMFLSNLHASGRVSMCSVYLWDPRIAAFSCVSFRGGTKRPLKAVAAGPFTEGLVEGAPWYARATVARKARTEERAAEVLALLDAMRADLAMPFVKGNVVLGWLNLRDEEWSDGYSADEILKLEEVAALGSVVLGNISDFQQIQEQSRLAALGQMAAGLAHEIRNPLAGVKGAAQFLQAEALSGDSKDMLQVIIDETNRLDLVVRQFLDYARPFELDRQQEHVNAVVTHVLTLLRASGVPSDVEVVEELAGDLPAMSLDSTRLSQVLLNLMQNALQAMPEGGRLTVGTRRVPTRQGPDVVEIVVRDTGTGISAENMEKLFIPFFTTKVSGTGLGLPICQRIVDAHGGDLDVQSVEDLGASFIVRLPFAEAEPPPVTEEVAV
ncbi:MAG: hypothetical protein KC656_11290 [Myxococcales bacterium]|nr:hypothetical protein [Myxococcales bacterium]